MIKTAALVALRGLSGCSFMAATTPRGSTHSCMPDHRAPFADAVVVGLAAASDVALAIHRQGERCGDFGCHDGVLGAAVTIFAMPYLASAIYGYAKDRCPPSDAPIAAEDRAQRAQRDETTTQRDRALERAPHQIVDYTDLDVAHHYRREQGCQSSVMFNYRASALDDHPLRTLATVVKNLARIPIIAVRRA